MIAGEKSSQNADSFHVLRVEENRKVVLKSRRRK
jgi:hypothetical protein